MKNKRLLTSFDLGTHAKSEEVIREVERLGTPKKRGFTVAECRRLSANIPKVVYDWGRQHAFNHEISLSDIVLHKLLEYMVEMGVDPDEIERFRPIHPLPRAQD